jgi:hypothetical protein
MKGFELLVISVHAKLPLRLLLRGIYLSLITLWL